MKKNKINDGHYLEVLDRLHVVSSIIDDHLSHHPLVKKEKQIDKLIKFTIVNCPPRIRLPVNYYMKEMKQKIKLYLDDVRNPKSEGWTVVRNHDDFVNHITEHGLPEEISFDHDLAEVHYDPITWKQGFTYHEKTGYDCAKWLVNECMIKGVKHPPYIVHSMNPVGKQNIISYVESYNKSIK